MKNPALQGNILWCIPNEIFIIITTWM